MRHTKLQAFAILGIATFFICSSAHAQRGPSRVEVAPVVQREVATGQTFVGTILPTRRAVVGSAVDGRVVEVFVDAGDRVEKNQPLAQLLTETIKLEIEAAKAELDLRKARLDELKNGSLPTEIEQARARMDRARIAVEYLAKEQKKYERLHQQNAASDSDLDKAVSDAMGAKEQYDEAKAAHQLAVDGPRREKIIQAQAEVAIQDALVRKLEDQLKKHTIISRFAGYITVKHSENGAWVSRGDPVAEVVALDEVDVVAKVVEVHAPYVHVGDSVRVEIPALAGETFTGKVTTIVPQADVRSRTFPVSVRVKNKINKTDEPLLKAGMLSRLTLATGELQQATLVPKDSLVLGGREPMIWIINPKSVESKGPKMKEGEAVAVPVQLGVAADGLIQVQGVIPAGSLVVTKGNERVPFSPTGDPSRVMWTEPATDAKSDVTVRETRNVND